MTITTVMWITAAASGVLTLAILFLGGFDTARQSARTILYTGAAAVTCAAYAMIAVGIGSTVEETGAPVEMARYGAWAVSAPMILAGLALTATPVRQRAFGETGALMFAGVAMAVAFAVGVLVSGVAAAAWFIVGLCALGAVCLILWGPLKERADSGHPAREEFYTRHAGVLTGLWLVYPLVLLLSPHFAGATGFGTMAVLFALLDFASRAAYGLFVVLEDDNLRTAETHEAAWDPLADAAAGTVGTATPGAVPVAVRPEAPLRDRLLARYHDTEARQAAMTRLRGRLGAARAQGLAHVRETFGPARRPEPLPAVRRHKRPAGGLWRTKFGPLRQSDIVPVATVAAALLLVARGRRD